MCRFLRFERYDVQRARRAVRCLADASLRPFPVSEFIRCTLRKRYRSKIAGKCAETCAPSAVCGREYGGLRVDHEKMRSIAAGSIAQKAARVSVGGFVDYAATQFIDVGILLSVHQDS